MEDSSLGFYAVERREEIFLSGYSLTLTNRNHLGLLPEKSTTMAVLLSLLSLKVAAQPWHSEIYPGFAPSVPSSASGLVDYTYEFGGYVFGGAACDGQTGVRNYARTWDVGTVGGNKVTDHGVCELYNHWIYRTCNGGQFLAADDHCRQEKNGMVSPPTYTPSSGPANCGYENGGFYEGIFADVDAAMQLPCYQLTTEYSSGPGWQMWYTHPAYTPLCWFYSSVLCDYLIPGGKCTVGVYGWSVYYSIRVLVDQGASPPLLPGMPGPTGGGVGPTADQGFYGGNISAGQFHSLAAKLDGTVWAWGLNSSGQLGDGTPNDHHSPMQVSNLSGVNAVSAGWNHSLALKSDGTVWAWGLNSNGQLGDGTTTTRYTPVPVINLNNVISISGGYESSYALKSDGTVWAWGSNGNGQLGDGTQTRRLTPVQVINLTGVAAISCGVLHGLAVKGDGTAWAWGYNFSGQLGDGTTSQRLSPVPVTNLTGVASISGGADHSVALKTDGTVWAWGGNTYGQLGNGTTTPSLIPIQNGSLSGVNGVDAGATYNLAVKSDGTVWAWGQNNTGQLGDGSTTDQHSPVPVSNLSQVTAINAGSYHSLAVRGDLTLRSWGWNSNGQLGDGTITQSLTPITVVGFSL